MILVTQNDDIYEIRFPYDPDIISMVKDVPGRRWNPEGKFWSVPLARLGFLVAQFKGTKYESQLMIKSDEDINVNASINEANAIPDIDISDVHEYVKAGLHLFNHQKDMLKFAKWRFLNGLRSGFVLADEPGCIEGSAQVRIREEHKGWTRETSIANLYKLFEKGRYIEIKTLEDNRFVYKPVANVLYKGYKHVINIRTEHHTLTCTPDHQIYTPSGWIEAGRLAAGDQVMMNGEYKYYNNKAIFLDDNGNEIIDPVCPRCGSTENIIRERGSKFLGYCRKCMYKLRTGTVYRDDDPNVYRVVDRDGYVKLFGYPMRFSPLYEKYYTGEGLYEHHQVWYEHTGHVIDTSKEQIHHKNGIKTDNRFENLQLVSPSEHQQLHIQENISHLPQNHKDAEFYYAHGKKIMLVPKAESIVEIIDNNETKLVYDITIDDPVVHNFVCNHFIVHNCGKTLEVTNWALYLRDNYHVKHCLIIACVNSAKYNWREDIIKHTDGKEVPYILGTRKKRDGSLNLSTGSKEKLDDLTTLQMYGGKGEEPLPFFLILNIEAVRMRVGKIYPIADRIIELINSDEIAMLALDEIHRNCFEYDTLIQTDQGLMKIGDIVESQCSVNVLSFDLSSDSAVYKPVIDRHRFTVESQLVELIIKEGDQIRKIRCTPDHEFYTRNRGWIAASDLTELDDIVFNMEDYNDN